MKVPVKIYVMAMAVSMHNRMRMKTSAVNMIKTMTVLMGMALPQRIADR